MANQPNGSGDLVSLDDAAQTPAAAPTSQDSIIDATDLFQQQLDQITSWKQQLAGQMDGMRRDGMKLLERQKALAVERTQLAGERGQVAADRQQIEKLQAEVSAESARLTQRAGELENAQRQLAELEAKREQAQRELAAREKSLAESEARRLAEDVRLREGLEQLEAERKRLAEAQRQAAQDRQKLDEQARDLAGRAQNVDQQNQSVSSREKEIAATQQQVQQAQAELQNKQNELAGQQADLQSQLAAVRAQQTQIEGERQQLAKQKQEFQKKFEAFEHEQAEQLDALSRQTKRITERRGAVEAAEANLEQTLSERIAQATELLRLELAQAKGGQGERLSKLEAQVRQSESAAQAWQAKEAQFQTDLSTTQGQLGKLKEELRQAGASIEKIAAERTSLAGQLETQIKQAQAEAAQWQQKLDESKAQSAGGSEAQQQAQADTAAVRKEFKALKIQFEQLKAAKENLEFQLEVRSEDASKQLENLRQGLTQQVAERDAQIAQLKAESGKAKNSKSGAPIETQKSQELAKQVQMLEQQRNELATQLFTIQDALRRQQEEALLAKNGLEAKLLSLSEKNSKLEAEKSAWKRTGSSTQQAPQNAAAAKQSTFQRDRLLRQARALRAFRLQIRDTQGSLEKGRAELAQQREQIRARKENLEQVKRLLEKQEMVMARKLADHNAIKTVAAVGMFVIMVLGSAFFGIYHFVHPTYRGEASVQLVPPPNLQGTERETWLNKQMEFVRSDEVTSTAWKFLREPDVHYAMHDIHDEWAGSLGSNLTMDLDSKRALLNVHYNGPDADGVAQVANALALAYASPEKRDSTEPTRSLGLGAQVLKATPPLYPVPGQDNRFMMWLGTVAVTLFVSLLLIMIFRFFISRQLREIDQMADADDLEDVKSELADGSKPALD